MYKDEIIDEVWANREAFMKKHSHDVSSMVQDLMKRQKQSGRTVVDRRVPQPSKDNGASRDDQRHG